MQIFEALVSVGREAQRFSDVIHQFIASRSEDPDFSVSVRSEPMGDQEHKVVTFWNDEAADAFSELWSSAA
ncbi:hypothetical protein BH11PSE2_BH11PSE2_06920 [soil metagenome]